MIQTVQWWPWSFMLAPSWSTWPMRESATRNSIERIPTVNRSSTWLITTICPLLGITDQIIWGVTVGRAGGHTRKNVGEKVFPDFLKRQKNNYFIFFIHRLKHITTYYRAPTMCHNSFSFNSSKVGIPVCPFLARILQLFFCVFADFPGCPAYPSYLS